MLTREENELLTRTGPGTPGGALMRCYWQPVAVSEELPPGAAPLPVRLLGEDLVLFRDERGQPGLLGLHCAHRGADLSYGRLEDGGIRCIYHGWLYDTQGRCLEQPGEPAGSTFCQRIHQTAYPCVEAGGLILAFLGGGDPPLLTPYEFLAAPAARRAVQKQLSECNYLQGNEGNFDPQHLGMLHRHDRVKRGSAAWHHAGFCYATMETEETGFGVRVYTAIPVEPDETLVSLHNFVLPNLSAFSTNTTPDGYGVNWHVPIDDTHHWVYRLQFDRTHEVPQRTDRKAHRGLDVLDNGYVRERTLANRYLQDREEIRSGRSFAGLGYDFDVQDACVTEGEGPIQDRTAEHLGYPDQGVIAARKLLLRAVAEVQAGREPPHVLRDTMATAVPGLVTMSELAPRSVDWRSYCRTRIAASQAAPALIEA